MLMHRYDGVTVTLRHATEGEIEFFELGLDNQYVVDKYYQGKRLSIATGTLSEMKASFKEEIHILKTHDLPF